MYAPQQTKAGQGAVVLEIKHSRLYHMCCTHLEDLECPRAITPSYTSSIRCMLHNVNTKHNAQTLSVALLVKAVML